MKTETKSRGVLLFLRLAKRLEKGTGTKTYVVKCVESVDPSGYMLQHEMPLMGGEWWTSDGIKHG